MSKKVIIGIIVCIVIVCAVIGIFFMLNKTNDKSSEGVIKQSSQNSESNLSNENNANTENEENTSAGNSKVLVVYYSAQNHTEKVAQKIANNLNADIFEITPVDVYSNEDLNWTNNNSRVTKEHNDESLRNIELTTTEVENWEDYDVVLIGYPIWWGIAAWPTNTFVKANDFTGKTVIPFCTAASSGLGQSGTLLERDAGTGNWVQGHRFYENPSDSEIKNWTDSLMQ